MESSNKKSNSPSKSPPAKNIKDAVSSDDEDDVIEEISIASKIKSLSPVKYFEKRGSFDYHKVKVIDQPMRRASAIEGLNSFKVSGIKEMDDKVLVKFSTITEEIKTDENDPKFSGRNTKPRRSILKNTFDEETLILTKIFDKKILFELIEKIDKEAKGNHKLYNDLVPKCFTDYWKIKEKNTKQCMQILRV